MEYIIKHDNMFYNKTISKNIFHWEEYKNAYIFKNKWEANKKLKEMIHLRIYPKIEIVRYKKNGLR